MRDLQKIYLENEMFNQIDPALYAKYHVKQGLRNENGTGVNVGLTRICDVMGYKLVDDKKVPIDGELVYRGFRVQDLVSLPFAYEQTSFLLIFGRLPSKDELEAFHETLMHNHLTYAIDQKYSTSNILNALQIDVLKMYGMDPNPDSDTIEERMYKGILVLSSIPLFMFSNYYHIKVNAYPLPDKSFAENILYLAKNGLPSTELEVQLMETLLVLHADHGGGNNSTFTNVVLSSTGTDIYSCLSAAIGSLKGPKHGGANIKVYEQSLLLFSETNCSTDPDVLYNICDRIMNKDFYDNSGLIYGIGHAIYTKSDPRARAIRQIVHDLAYQKGKAREYECLSAFEKTAIKYMLDKKGEQKCANVDFYSGFAYSLLGIHPALYTPLFCISRTSGWIAHHLENRLNNRKLIRPGNVYVGDYYF